VRDRRRTGPCRTLQLPDRRNTNLARSARGAASRAASRWRAGHSPQQALATPRYSLPIASVRAAQRHSPQGGVIDVPAVLCLLPGFVSCPARSDCQHSLRACQDHSPDLTPTGLHIPFQSSAKAAAEGRERRCRERPGDRPRSRAGASRPDGSEKQHV